MNWDAFWRRGDQQDLLFLQIRDRFPDMDDREFREKVMLPISFGVFTLSFDVFISALPDELRTEVMKAFTDAASSG